MPQPEISGFNPMSTQFNVLEWIKSIPKVHVAVRITIVPPWKISDVPNHAAVNLGTLSFIAVLYLLARVFTPSGAYGLTEIGVVTLFTCVFLLLSGIVVNFLAVSAVKMSNRWSTFLIVDFMFSLFVLIALFVTLTFLSGHNLIDLVTSLLPGGNAAAYLACTFVASAFSMCLLYWRTRRWFYEVIRRTPRYFYISIVFCGVINWLVLFATIYVI